MAGKSEEVINYLPVDAAVPSMTLKGSLNLRESDMIYEITGIIIKRVEADNINEALCKSGMYGANPISITCESNGDSFDVKKCDGCGKLLLETEYDIDCDGAVFCLECELQEKRYV